jgi:hypothetical protein
MCKTTLAADLSTPTLGPVAASREAFDRRLCVKTPLTTYTPRGLQAMGYWRLLMGYEK